MKKLCLAVCLMIALCCLYMACAAAPRADSVGADSDSASSVRHSASSGEEGSHSDAESASTQPLTDAWPVTYDLSLLQLPAALNTQTFSAFFLYVTACTNEPAVSANEIASPELLRAMVECYSLLYPELCAEQVSVFPEEQGWPYVSIPVDPFLAFTQTHLGIDALEVLAKDFVQGGEYPILILDEVEGKRRILLHPTLNFAPNTIAQASVTESGDTVEILVVKNDARGARLNYVFDVSAGYDAFQLVAIQ